MRLAQLVLGGTPIETIPVPHSNHLPSERNGSGLFFEHRVLAGPGEKGRERPHGRYQRYPHDLRVLIEQSALILEEHVLAELTHLMT